jgi:ATP-dependent helicase HrpA
MKAIHELEDAHRRVLEELPAGAVDGELSEVPWLLEELRISYFAQAIGPKDQPSAKRIRRILEDATH